MQAFIEEQKQDAEHCIGDVEHLRRGAERGSETEQDTSDEKGEAGWVEDQETSRPAEPLILNVSWYSIFLCALKGSVKPFSSHHCGKHLYCDFCACGAFVHHRTASSGCADNTKPDPAATETPYSHGRISLVITGESRLARSASRRRWLSRRFKKMAVPKTSAFSTTCRLLAQFTITAIHDHSKFQLAMQQCRQLNSRWWIARHFPFYIARVAMLTGSPSTVAQ